MSGFFGTTTADLVATWVAAIVTLVVFGALVGERRLFGWSQHLLAGLATGFLALIVLDRGDRAAARCSRSSPIRRAGPSCGRALALVGHGGRGPVAATAGSR